MFTTVVRYCAMPSAAQRLAFVIDSVGGAMYCTITVPRASLPRHGSAPWHTADTAPTALRQRRLMEKEGWSKGWLIQSRPSDLPATRSAL